jgi:DNA-binding LacI/PurR family transcriptional regulator
MRKSSDRELRHQTLKRELAKLIRGGAAGEMLPSYTEMIRRFGVGQNTIDRVIREFDQAGFIIRKKGKGMFISPRATCKNIGFVFGRDFFEGFHSPIAALLMKHCRDRAAKGKESFKFYLDLPAPPRTEFGVPLHQELGADIKAGRLDGVMVVWSYGPEETAWLRSLGIPVVSLGAEEDLDAHSVIIDYLDLVAQGVSALVRAGAKNVALLSTSGHLRRFGFNKDLEAFRAALAGFDLPYRPEFVLQDLADRSINAGGPVNNEELGFLLMSEFLAAHGISDDLHGRALPIDGLLSEDDMCTRGALMALHQASIPINAGLILATHVNKGSPALKNYARHLIRLEIDPGEVVNAMLELLAPMMRNEPMPSNRRLIRARVVDVRA